MKTRALSGGTIHSLPDDIKAALATSPQAGKQWENITPLARNEWICWVTMVKMKKTREKRIRRLIESLQAGKKRPCCWPGCPHHNPNLRKWLNNF